MKRGWLAAALLALILCLSAWHVSALGRMVADLSMALEQAEEMAEAGDWEGADGVTRQAREDWDGQGFHLRVTLDHAVLDQIDVGFAETLEFIECRESGEYSAANARLRRQLELLGEMERPLPENLL